MILLYSIPHTGTHFTAKLLDGLLSGAVHITGDPEDTSKYTKIVVPLRHPEKVAESWAKRFELRGSQQWKQWEAAWEYLYELEPDPRVFFFDLERKDLKGLSEFVGQELTTDWAPENHIEYDAAPLITPEQVRAATAVYEYCTRSLPNQDQVQVDQ